MFKKKNKRVVAIRDIEDNVVNIYGYGEYLGKKICPDFFNIKNPCIKLDSGKIIWGYQCWWTDVDNVEKLFKDKLVKMVDFEEKQ